MKNSSKSRRIEFLLQYLQYLTSIIAIAFMVCYTQIESRGLIYAAIGIVSFSAICFMLQIILLNISASIEARKLTEFDDYAFDELFSIGDTKKRNPNITHYRNIEFGGFIKDTNTVLLSDDGPIELEVPEQMIAKCLKLKMKNLISVVVERNEGANRCKGILFLDGIFSWWLKDGTASDENTRKNLTSLTE